MTNKKTFIKVMQDCGIVSIAAKAAGISRQTAYNHRHTDSDFATQWDDAIRQASEVLEFEARRRAFEGVLEPVYYRGEVVGQVRKYSDTLIIFLLKGLKPNMYRDNFSVDINGSIEKLVKIINEECPDRASAIRRRIQTDLLGEEFN
ncbi:MAG: hypothetical protein JXR73_06230 [Candidatus Omnitrophica bacterium]|nr:hypothetical protein [Candidatus Omnitrophota bacterium]